MAEFSYKAVNATGEELTGEMEARSREAVVDRLHGMNYIPIRVEPATSTKPVNQMSITWL